MELGGSMKLVDAVDIAKACGLTTIKDAFANIDIHATMVFAYTKMEEELNELYKEIIALFEEMDVETREDITIEEYENFIGGIK
jgi:dihydroorotate dehydrogenase